MRNSNDGPDRHSNCAIQITHRDVILHTHAPKIPLFEWSFELRNLNLKSNCALSLSCENSMSDQNIFLFI